MLTVRACGDNETIINQYSICNPTKKTKAERYQNKGPCQPLIIISFFKISNCKHLQRLKDKIKFKLELELPHENPYLLISTTGPNSCIKTSVSHTLLIAMFQWKEKPCINQIGTRVVNARILLMRVTTHHAKPVLNYDYLTSARIMHIFESQLA